MSEDTKMDVAVEVAVAPETPVVSEPPAKITLQDITKTVSYITRGVELNQPRLLQRAIRQNANTRKFIDRELLMQTISKFIPVMCPTFDAMAQAASLVPSKRTEEAVAQAPATFDPPSEVIPEVEVYIFNTIVTTLLREQKYVDAAVTSTALVERIRSFNRRSLDLMASKAFLYFSLAYEKLDKLEDIRPTLLALYRTSCIRRDEMSQSVLLNLVLRNYLHYNLVEQAQTLSVRTTFPENASNNQFCRYLYYMGRIQAIQLEYSSSYQRLMMAVRKAPQDVGVGFIVIVQKLSVIVQLLMGEIPERSLFNQPELRAPLRPYLALTQAVRNGDLQQFNEVVDKYSVCFTADKNFSLVLRLGHNVIKTGLKKISISYSRISLADVAAKLHLPSASSAEYICAKSIRDGVIEATIDHSNGWLLSNDIVDVYSTEEPQKAFHKRIAFCLDVYNESVKAMRYPPDAYKKELNRNVKTEVQDERSIDELLQDMENDFDE